ARFSLEGLPLREIREKLASLGTTAITSGLSSSHGPMLFAQLAFAFVVLSGVSFVYL
ncbi:MAG: hypothetical protein SGPRY_008908, partial [Prymnesium sp.]